MPCGAAYLLSSARRLIPFFLIFIALSTVGASGQTVLRLATGSTQGVYHAFGLALRSAVDEAGLGFKIEVLPTDGSQANAQLLTTGVADLAMMQADTAYDWKLRNNTIEGVASLYTEVVHILISRSSDIGAVDDLRTARIALGAKGSGSLPNARRILNALGIYRDQFEEVVASPAQITAMFSKGEVDAAFVVAGVPTPTVETIGSSVRLMGLSPRAIEALTEEYPFFVPASIPRGIYAGQEREVSSVGLRALLVARPACPAPAVHELLNLIVSSEPIGGVLNQVGERLSLVDVATKGMPLELHQGAAKYYRYRMLWVRVLARWAVDILLLIGIAVFCVCLFVSPYRFFKRIRRSVYLRILVAFVCVYLASTVAIHFFERDGSSSFVTLPQSFWSTIVYVLSGIEEREPETVLGRGFSVVLLLTNIALLGLIVGEFAATLIRHKGGKMPARTKGNITICNWNIRGDRVVRELHEARRVAPDILVLTDSDVPEETLRKNPYYDTVVFVRSDPQLHSTLEAARVYQAESIVILANEDSPDPDASSALIALAISKICKNHNVIRDDGAGPHIVAEAVNHRKKAHLKDAGVNEVICPADYGLGVLAQCAVNHDLSDVYDRLLTYSNDTNEIYVLDRKVRPEHFPEGLVGKTFSEASRILNDHRDPGNPTVLIGVKVRRDGKDDQTLLNPKDDWDGDPADKFERIGPNDALIVMSFRHPDLSSITA